MGRYESKNIGMERSLDFILNVKSDYWKVLSRKCDKSYLYFKIIIFTLMQKKCLKMGSSGSKGTLGREVCGGCRSECVSWMDVRSTSWISRIKLTINAVNFNNWWEEKSIFIECELLCMFPTSNPYTSLWVCYWAHFMVKKMQTHTGCLKSHSK